jgi:SH3-like domain-containing protein
MKLAKRVAAINDSGGAAANNAAGLAALLFSAAISANPPLAAQTPTGEKSQAAVSPVATGSAAAPAPQKTFVTVGDKPAVLYDAPSNRANKTFILNRLTPLEVLVKLERMTKVRDAEGTIGWVENSGLGERRHVQVATVSADIRAMPSPTSALVFDAQKAVALEVTGAATADGWLPVKHRDGQAGFVRLTQIWGD